MKVFISIIAVLTSFSFPALAYEYESPQQAEHHSHQADKELDAKYSKHQGAGNLDQRFWVSFNEVSSLVSTARDKVNKELR